jgi:hypothetical protein
MTVTHRWERDKGYRICKDGVSILQQALAGLKKDAVLTSEDWYNYFRRIKQYLESIGANPVVERNVRRILTIDDFPDKTIPFYKFGADYILKDSFRFGTIADYRTIEKEAIRDEREGWCSLIIAAKKRSFGATLISGYNYYIFSGSWSLENRDEKAHRFGSKVVEIANVKEFAQDVKSILGAKRFVLKKVIYDDLNIFKTSTLRSFDDVNVFHPQNIDDASFEFLQKRGVVPSLYVKPTTRFPIEQEFRLVFEMRNDVQPTIIADRGLMRHVEVVD